MMHWIKCNLLATILCATYAKNSVAPTELLNTEGTRITVDSKYNKVNYPFTKSGEFTGTEKIISNFNLTSDINQEFQNEENLISEQKASNITSSNAISLKSDEKRDVENVTFNDIKSFLLFPILSFLFPPKEDESLNFESNEFIISKNKTSKVDGNPGKPFIFFNFSFNHRTPLNNNTGNLSDSKIINVKKLRVSESDDLKNYHDNRKRRNANIKTNTNGFFDHSPLFPDSELEEFLPKPDLFFPDLPFHHKPLKKVNRRKQGQKKPDFKNDLKFFFDAFDDAFMRTKTELERADPILNFLRGGELPFNEEKKEEDDFFSHLPVIQEKPRVKWKIQRNIKQLNNDNQDRLKNGQDSPMIVVDKVVKIKEFHMYDEGKNKNKLNNKKEINDLKKRNSKEDEATTNDNDETFSKNIFELIKQEGNKRKKRNYSAKSDGSFLTKIQTQEIKILPQMNTSFLSVGNNATIEVKKKGTKLNSQKVNTTEKVFKYENFMKVNDSLKTKIKEELTDSASSTTKRLKQKGSSYYEKLNSTKASYDNLKKNISDLLNQFLELAKNLDDVKLMERLEVGERNNAGVFDRTEKETSQSTDMLGKYSREKRQKKAADFEDEYIDLGKKERQIAELNYLFLTVTLPTVFIFALALLVCFFSLQVKGKLCSRLFKPRQIFITEDENPTQLKCSTKIKTQSKAQAI